MLTQPRQRLWKAFQPLDLGLQQGDGLTFHGMRIAQPGGQGFASCHCNLLYLIGKPSRRSGEPSGGCQYARATMSQLIRFLPEAGRP
jgi:hypothetical protein